MASKTMTLPNPHRRQMGNADSTSILCPTIPSQKYTSYYAPPAPPSPRFMTVILHMTKNIYHPP